MNNHIKKLSLSIELTDNSDQYIIECNNSKIKRKPDLHSIYEFDLDVSNRNTIQVHYNNKSTHSHLQIKKIMFNNIELHHLDLFSTYHANGKVKKTYGWMDEIGTYKINIHGNPVSHQFLTFLISKKQ